MSGSKFIELTLISPDRRSTRDMSDTLQNLLRCCARFDLQLSAEHISNPNSKLGSVILTTLIKPFNDVIKIGVCLR